MSLPQTEAVSDNQVIDSVSMDAGAVMLLDGQNAAIEAVRKVVPELTVAASLMAAAINADGRVIYGAAGSSGLMALADASELHGTFGIPHEQVQIHMAGGVPADGVMPGDTEDDTAAARGVVMTANDVAIVLSASGSTPFALALAETAQQAGAKVIAIANNPDAALFAHADVAICLQTPAELIAGSTRLGAGTAQKVALNVMSSLMGVRLGHVYQGMMVNVVADNIKLRARAATMIRQIAQVSEDKALAALHKAGNRVKPAILVASGQSLASALLLLDRHRGHLGPCLQAVLKETT